MRLISKYKIYTILHKKFKKFPLRLFKFKRPKWLKIQKLLKDSKSKFKNKKVNIPSNLLLVKNSFKYWESIKKYYKNNLLLRHSFSNLFNNKINYKQIKKNLKFAHSKKEVLDELLLKLEFRLDLFLWNTKFFSSSYQSSQKIKSGLVSINGIRVYSNIFLRKGDIISFDLPNFELKNILNKFSFDSRYLPFIEIDYYTNTIIILKSYDEISYSETYLISNEYVNVKRLSCSL
jgi:ribosomal protein S4